VYHLPTTCNALLADDADDVDDGASLGALYRNSAFQLINILFWHFTRSRVEPSGADRDCGYVTRQLSALRFQLPVAHTHALYLNEFSVYVRGM